MLKQFILNGAPYEQTSDSDRITYLLSIGCIEVPILYDKKYYIPLWNGTIFYESADEFFILEQILLEYESHRYEGIRNYNVLRSKIVYAIRYGTLTESEAFEIESVLSEGWNKIYRGDWKTALYMFNSITNIPIIVKPFYDETLSIVNEYITNYYLR